MDTKPTILDRFFYMIFGKIFERIFGLGVTSFLCNNSKEAYERSCKCPKCDHVFVNRRLSAGLINCTFADSSFDSICPKCGKRWESFYNEDPEALARAIREKRL